MACIKAKIATAPLTLALLLSLAACGGSSGGGTSNTPAGDVDTPTDGGGSDGGGSDGGSSDGGGETPLFSVTNPYAIPDAATVTDVKVDTMYVFGDSYTARRTASDGTSSVTVEPWADTMVTNGFVDNAENFARSGARANSSATNSFEAQVDAAAVNYTGNDLTIAYFGYNDLGRSLTGARNSYIEQVDRLIAAGATENDRRLFVTLIHDWDRNPANQPDATEDDVENLNGAYSDFANSRDNVVAVDLFTLFNRIYDNPERFGFDNVTTSDTANSGSTALYGDANHFGQRGVDIIAQVYQHYLTRAWDWSNTLANGQMTIDQLNSDIDEGLLTLSLDQPLNAQQQALSFFQVGSQIEPGAGRDSSFDTGIKSLSQDADGGAGMGMNYRLGQNAQMGLVLSQYRDESEVEHNAAVSGTGVEAQAMSVYLDQKVGKFRFDTRLTLADNDYRVSSFDAVVDGHNGASTSGSGMSLQQKVSRAFRTGGGWIQPFASLSIERQELDSYTLTNSFIADTHYSAADTNDVWAGLGMSYSADAIKLGHESSLRLSSGLSYRQSVYRDDYKVTITDTAFGGREDATLARENAEQFSFNLNSDLALGEQVGFGLGYNFTASSEAEDDIHSLRADLTFRF